MTVIIMTPSIMIVITMTLSMMTQHKSSTCGCRQISLFGYGGMDGQTNTETDRQAGERGIQVGRQDKKTDR